MSEQPFPGLRPFRQDETDVFFGRESSLDTMLDRLAAHRFLAVTGASGSGKSSLVFTGLIDALHRGLLARAGSDWTVVTMRPGAHPLRALAASLAAALPRDEAAPPIDLGEVERLRAHLARGPLALRECLGPVVSGARGRNVLLVVDQFEELFRFRAGDSDASAGVGEATETLAWREEAQAFVDMLLESAAQREVAIYIVLTLRSDFLGDCTQLNGLAEAINDSQFLTPRLTREQLRRTIVGPVGVYDATIEPALVNRLLNEMGANSDQLPLMQHGLMRLWDSQGAEKRHTAARYAETLGNLRDALNAHADEILGSLQPGQQPLAELMFRSLSQGSGTDADRRRPTALAEIGAIAGVAWEEFVPVIEAFRAKGCHFLTPELADRPSAASELSADTVIDVSHESLIRQWNTLRAWVRAEAEDVDEFVRLRDRADRWRKQNGPLLTGTDLDIALKWRQRELLTDGPDGKPATAKRTEAWAQRYGGRLGEVEDFIGASNDQRERERRQDRLVRYGGVAAAFIAVLLAGFAVFAHINQSRLQRQDIEMAAAFSNHHLTDGDTSDAVSLILSKLDSDQLGAPEWAATVLQKVRASDRELIAMPAKGVVNFAAYSPDGSRVVAATSYCPAARQCRAYLWDAKTGARLTVLDGHHDRVMGAAFSPGDGRLVATASYDGYVRFWDARTGAAVGQPLPACVDGNVASEVTFVAFSSKGDGGRHLVASCSSPANVARVWDVSGATPKQVAEWRSNGPVNNADFSPADARQVVLATSDASHAAYLWNWQANAHGGPSASVTLASRSGRDGGHTALVNSAHFSPDGSRVVTASADRTAIVWDVSTRDARVQSVLSGHDAAVNFAAFSPSGDRVVTAAADQTVGVWDARSGKRLSTLYGNGASVASAVFSPNDDGDHILTGSTDKTARIFTARPVSEDQVLVGHEGSVTSGTFSPDASRLVTASADLTAKVWDAHARTSIQTTSLLTLIGHTAPVNAAAFSPDGRHIVTGSNDHTARIWNALSAAQDSPLVAPDAAGGPSSATTHNGNVVGVAYSTSGRWIATASYDGTAIVWNAATGSQRSILRGHANVVYSAAFSPADEDRLVTASWDGTARVWDVRDPSRPRTITTLRVPTGGPGFRFESASFSPGGALIVTGSNDRTVRIWDAQTGQQVGPPLTGHSDTVYHVEFSPDGRRVLSSSEDNTARVWDVADPAHFRQVGVLVGHTDGLRWASYARGGDHIVTASVDGTVRIWQAPVELSAADEVSWARAAQFESPCQTTDELSLLSCPVRPTATKNDAHLGDKCADFDQQAATASDKDHRDAALRQGFKCYADAADRALHDGADDATWAPWRTRRASIARLLAADGLMAQVAQDYQGIYDKWRQPSLLSRLLHALQI